MLEMSEVLECELLWLVGMLTPEVLTAGQTDCFPRETCLLNTVDRSALPAGLPKSELAEPHLLSGFSVLLRGPSSPQLSCSAPQLGILQKNPASLRPITFLSQSKGCSGVSISVLTASV